MQVTPRNDGSKRIRIELVYDTEQKARQMLIPDYKGDDVHYERYWVQRVPHDTRPDAYQSHIYML